MIELDGILPESWLAAVPIVLAVAAAVGFGLHRFGSRELRSWALPAGVAILAGGLGHVFALPNWLVVLIFFAIPVFVHRSVRKRFEAAVAGASRIPIGDGEEPLAWKAGQEGTALGAWRSEGAEALVVWLDFIGETEDAFSVELRAESPKGRPGLLFCRHAAGQILPPEALRERSPVVGLPGQEETLELRALPEEFAFNLLDIPALAALSEMLEFRGFDREIAVTISGRHLRLESNAIFDAEELRRLVPAFVKLFRKLREVGIRDATG